MKFPSKKFYTFDLIIKLDFLPNHESFPKNICDGFACRQGALSPSGHLVLSRLYSNLFIKPKAHYLPVMFIKYDIFTEIYITEYSLVSTEYMRRATCVACKQGTIQPGP